MKLASRTFQRAFALNEGLILIALLVIVTLILLPHLVRHRKAAGRINCVNNLKQTHAAFQVWAANHHEKYPMQVSQMQGGTLELNSNGTAHPHFSAISNELATPGILICPADVERNPASDFTTRFKDANISYFINIDASIDAQQMFLTGDRNLTINDIPVGRGLVEVNTNQLLGWTALVHTNRGNIGKIDGSVMTMYSRDVNRGFQDSRQATNRLAMP